MAIKVIKYGKRTARCSYCESKLQYEIEDVKAERMGMDNWKGYIVCPVCEEKIYVNS